MAAVTGISAAIFPPGPVFLERHYSRQVERVQVVSPDAKFGCWLASAVYREHRFLAARALR